MSVVVIVGAQWGDEGKGKIIDYLSKDVDIVARFQGGDNAGHTVIYKDKELVLHLIPCGILHEKAICIIGSGVVINPKALVKEINNLVSLGINLKDRLFISESAHVIMPYHACLDRINERLRGKGKIGTTGKGIGPAYMDLVSRVGIRIIDLLDKEIFVKKLEKNLEEKRYFLEQYNGWGEFNFDEIKEEYLNYGQEIEKYVSNTIVYLNEAIKAQKKILFEGAQGALLDVYYGTFPYVTSSNTTAGGACIGSGIGPTEIKKVIGVTKAYTTRVGEGPFPTELDEEMNNQMRIKGKEFGATTGRPRRCGWLDIVALKHAKYINGFKSIIMTKLDILSGLKEIKICTGYKYKERILKDFPSSLEILGSCQPIYEILPGWEEDISEISNFKDLPSQAKGYLSKVEELLEVKIELISTGPKRFQITSREVYD
ncbi:adenylosuccinate synthase [bacterium]|nr:adenylosuccinate synthase [bacterium]MBU2600324.1 adenylosuccinate synthase [bacterium]